MANGKKSQVPQLYARSIASPLGSMVLVVSDQGVRALQHALPVDAQTEHPLLDEAERQLQEYFAGSRRDFELPLDMTAGTTFQKKVWQSLLAIPYGTVISYGEQTRRLGMGKAYRAVGAANGKNPLGIIVPCHRVVSSQGHLHGYAGGLPMKKFLLELEGLPCLGNLIGTRA